MRTFRGRHNSIKFKCLWSLLDEVDREHTAREIAEATGVGYRSVVTSLPKWVRWRYITRRSRTIDGYRYRIAVKGQRFVEESWSIAPVERYRFEMSKRQGVKIII